LLKIFNGNFVAATRMLYAMGRRNLIHPSLGRVHAAFGTPVVAIVLMGVLTMAAAMSATRSSSRSPKSARSPSASAGCRPVPHTSRGGNPANRPRWRTPARRSASRSC